MADTAVQPARVVTARAVTTARRRRRVSLIPLLYVLPAFAVYLTVVIAPWVQSIWTSLWDWNGIGVARWVGIGNYADVLTEPALRGAVLNAFGFIIFYSVIPIALGLVLAALVAATPWKAMPVIRTVLFLPQILPLVAVGVVWRWVYSERGPLNEALTAVGLGEITRPWLGDFDWAFPAVGFIGTWVCTGLCFLLLLAGIGKIDPALYEAAKLDGVGPVREFWHITVPGLRQEIAVAATITIIAALAGFDVVYVMTGGGPGYKTMVPGVQVYELVFTAGRVGTACALATVLSALTCAVMYLVNRIARERP
ncbi:sugar ABC transporter permease [Amycolatopsis sp. PS_44_ISF1]|uniref:carbohydrate ABC transporter permease n=1 Tax=Amycolatopsis sp. PS_44_ISF1 TaxID=2974917 RepID=UPI0028DDB9EE|nr:sugar ABC transporter permease [Amycolatopsis sp. PS_44_ISF1]MDT8913708.1 sugar ABC transporter permease [Amycolatopsis sp. PS_44_ISF1]